MRAQARHVRHEEEEESAFVSMTDMTVGFLFIMMILLAFFASQAKETDTVPRSSFNEVVAQRDELRAKVKELTAQNATLVLQLASAESRIEELTEEIAEKDREIARLKARLEIRKPVTRLDDYLQQVSHTRREVLVRLRDAILLDFPELKVELSEDGDALRFQGEGLFLEGSSDLRRDKAEIVTRLGERLNEILPCFTLGAASQFDESCNPEFALVEAVQIEGHTDARGSDALNRNLSTARANSTFFAMTGAAKGLMQHLNLREQPVMSVAAYGADRPVVPNDTVEGRATNRRIDLRFIMVTPKDIEGIELIREALRNASEVRP